MNKDELTKISFQQTERFFYSYSPDWRFAQILSIEKQLLNRYDFFNDIVTQTKDKNSNTSNTAVIAQEITNGLFFEAMAISIQSIEDLFALLSAGKTPLKFIGSVITYNAGKIDNLIKQKQNLEDIISLFYFPLFNEGYESKEQQDIFEKGASLLYETIIELKTFYKFYRFFYNQYKHGLSVVFRAFCDYNETQIEQHKNFPSSAYLQVFDNISLSKLENEDVRRTKKIMMPHLTTEIINNLNQLFLENNLLRFVSANERIEFEKLKSIVIKSRICVGIFGNNLMNSLKGFFPMVLQLPADLNNGIYSFSFPEDVYKMATNKRIFIRTPVIEK